MDTIKIESFAKLDIRIGKVIEATEVEGSEKLVRCVVDFGELGKKIIFSGIKKWYKPEDLVGKLLPYIVNLEPRKMPSYVKTSEGKFVQEESQGMLVAAAPEDKAGEKEAVLLAVDREVAPGTKII